MLQPHTIAYSFLVALYCLQSHVLIALGPLAVFVVGEVVGVVVIAVDEASRIDDR